MPSFLKLTKPPAATTNTRIDTAKPSLACRVLKCALLLMICTQLQRQLLGATRPAWDRVWCETRVWKHWWLRGL